MSARDVTSDLRSIANEVKFTQKWNLLILVVEVLISIAQCVESGLRVVGLLELGELLRLDTLSVGIGGSLIVVEGDSIEEYAGILYDCLSNSSLMG